MERHGVSYLDRRPMVSRVRMVPSAGRSRRGFATRPRSSPARVTGRRAISIGVVLLLVTTLWAAGSTERASPSRELSRLAPAAIASRAAAEVAAAQASLRFGSSASLQMSSGTPASLHWLEMNSNAMAPSPRSAATLAYDPELNAVVLFGGYFVQVAPAGDTWEFKGGAWTQWVVSPGGSSPAARWGAAMVYDPSIESLVLFGGRDLTQFFNDTWYFNAGGWSEANTPVAPSPRFTTMAYDAALDSIVVYGGGTGNLPAGSESTWSYYSDTWEFAAGVWKDVTGSVGAAPQPGDVTMVYDPTLGGELLLGGSYPYGLCAALPETWTFTGGHWSNVSATPASGPGGRQGLAGYGMVYDVYLGAVVTFGGNTANGAGGCYSVGSTWEYSGGAWVNITASVGSFAPAGRQQIQVASDPTGGFDLLFGGNIDNSDAYLGDTWALTSNATVFAPQTGTTCPGGSSSTCGPAFPVSSGDPASPSLWSDLSGSPILIAVAAFAGGLVVGVVLVRRRPPSGDTVPRK
jgi:Galactose oxidase, central domain